MVQLLGLVVVVALPGCRQRSFGSLASQAAPELPMHPFPSPEWDLKFKSLSVPLLFADRRGIFGGGDCTLFTIIIDESLGASLNYYIKSESTGKVWRLAGVDIGRDVIQVPLSREEDADHVFRYISGLRRRSGGEELSPAFAGFVGLAK